MTLRVVLGLASVGVACFASLKNESSMTQSSSLASVKFLRESIAQRIVLWAAGLEEQGVAGKAGADRAIRYLNRAGLDEGSGTSQVRFDSCLSPAAMSCACCA